MQVDYPSVFYVVRDLARRAYDARIAGCILAALRFERACESLARVVGESEYSDLVTQGQEDAQRDIDARKAAQ